MTKTKRAYILLRRFFVPSYSEVRIFFMALSFVLLVYFDQGLKDEIRNMFSKAFTSGGRPAMWTIVATFFFIPGLILSIYHAFSSRRKSEPEKTFILVFALGINGVTSLIAGTQILNNYHGLMLVFPALNIFNSLILLYLIGFDDHSILDDENAAPPKLLTGSIDTAITFYFCQFRFGLHWPVTFSICVAYAMNINDIVERLPDVSKS